MSSLIISSASHSSPRIFIYHSSHIILIPSSFHSIILAFFTFPLIHFTMVLFAISSKLIFSHFIYHTLLFIIPSSFPSYFTSITLINTLLCFSFLFASMFFIHSFASIPVPFFLSVTSNTLLSISIPILSFHFFSSIPFISYSFLTIHSHIFSGIVDLHYPWLTFISSISILIPLFFILFIQFISFVCCSSTCFIYEFYTMFVRILLIALSFVVLIGNTLSQLEVPAFTSDG